MKLSIITINWNNRDGLRQTIDSVLSQTARTQFEYIVIDGGAADGSGEMLKNEYNSKLDKWISNPIKPIYQKMNIGVQMATGDYCLFLNSGDSFHDENVIYNVLDQLHDEDFIIGKMVFLATGNLSQVSAPITLLTLYDSCLPHNATFIRRKWLLRYPYDEQLRIVSDWKFFVQSLILDSASYRIIDNIISDFECGGISSKNRDVCEQERGKVLKDLLPERILLDYFQFRKGSSYQDTPYDRFYVKLRNYRSGHALYSINVIAIRILGVFKKSARWANSFPIRHIERE